MVTLERTTRRVGRSQAASIFWGLVSCFFAAAACYYFWKYHENDTTTNVLRDQVLTLQEQLETLNSQKDQLQSNMSDTEAQLKSREEFLQDKETKLGEEESRLEGLAAQSDTQSAQSGSQAAVVKKFNDAVRKLVKGNDTDVVVRGGRPVLRVPSSLFFDFGETTLKPEGKTMLRQIAQTLDGQLGNFELRIETFTDSEGETAPSGKPAATDSTATPGKNATAPNADDKTSPANPAAPVKAPENPGWVLTGKRAGVLARYIREQTSLPFQNVLVIPRADSQPIIPSGTESNARNRRVEITITPLPAVFRASDVTGLDSVKPAGVKPTDHKSDQPANHSAAKTPAHVKPAVSKSSDASKTDDDSETPAPAARKSTTQSSKQ